MIRPLAFLALAACITPDDLDNTHISGFVSIPPLERPEVARNDTAANAQDLGEIAYQNIIISGAFESWGETDGDFEWVTFTVPSSLHGSVRLTWGSTQAPELPLPGGDTDTDVPADTDTDVPADTDTDTGVADTDLPPDTDVPADTADTAGDTAGVSYTSWVRVAIAEVQDGTSIPVPLGGGELYDGAGEIEFDFEPGHQYLVRLVPMDAADPVPTDWTFVMQSLNPDGANIKVGGYESSDPVALGNPVLGTSVEPFELQEDWSWRGPYRTIFAKSVDSETDTDGGTTVTIDEHVPSAWLFAGTFPTLNSGLRAGTWYSSDPIEVTLGSDEVVVDDDLVLDAFAVAQEGFALTEVEPNEVDLGADVIDFSTAQDIGVLSGPGFLDTVTGTIDILSDAQDYVHDEDYYAFTTPVDETIFVTLEWPDGAAYDLDLYVFDENVDYETYGYSAGVSDPEAAGTGAVFPAGTTFYILVSGYSGPSGTATPYTLGIEGG